MFGHQDDQPAQQDSDTVTDDSVHEAPNPEAGETTVAPTDIPADQPVDPPADPSADSASGEPDTANPEEIIIKPEADDQVQTDQPQTDQTDQPNDDDAKPEPPPAADSTWQHPGSPLNTTQEPIKDVISPAGGYPKKTTFQYPAALADSGSLADEQPDTGGAQTDDDLIHVKKQALEELSPLVDKLDLPPEEKFRTIMMMIQASDDESLVKAAYEAAHAIEDEKARAQALLDVVNEVNYFTQQPTDQSPEQTV
ncbi:MAG TPA: hypothetical protein VMU97_00965 [Candidatus Dormibacteraeota bacterium]|nr:hypothetical protein [Candidatus Dormibacteraeota bacterium]